MRRSLIAASVLLPVAALAKPATRTIVLDDIPLPEQTSSGGKVLPDKPYHATIVVPDATKASRTDVSTKFDPDAIEPPYLEGPGWTIELAHMEPRTMADVAKDFGSSHFVVISKAETGDGYVVVAGHKAGVPSEVYAYQKKLGLLCHGFVKTGAARDAVVAACQSLAAN